MSDDENYTSPLRAAAIQMHELYTELRAAGFTRTEAMELIAKTMATAVAEVQRNEEDE